MTSTRERILDAAWELAVEHGYRATTLAMIQQRASVHPGSFYWHFSDKDALFAALVDRAAGRTDVMPVRLHRGSDDNPLRAVLASIADNPQRYGLWRFNVQLMLDEQMRTSATADRIRALRERTQSILTRAWLEHIPSPVLAADPELPDRLAQFSLVTIEGCVLSRVAGTPRDEDMVTAVASYTMDRMVAAVCEAAGQPVPDFFRHRERRLAQIVTGRPAEHPVEDR